MRIEILHAVGDDPKGAVIDVDDQRGLRLIRTGYAVAREPEELPRLKKTKEKET